MEIIKVNENLLVFYIEGEEYPFTSTVLFKGDKALIFDTMDSLENARRVKDYLTSIGLMHFTVINTHWHWDHVGGNSLYEGYIIAHKLCREAMEVNKNLLAEKFPLKYPNLTFDDIIVLYLDDIKIELIHTIIHSRDSIIAFIPEQKLLLAGDTLESPLPYIDEIEDIPLHINNLYELRKMDIDFIIPSHCNKDKYLQGGYDKKLIDANYHYLLKLISQVNCRGFLNEGMEEYASITGDFRESYRAIHRSNQKLVYKHYKDRDKQ